MTDKRDEPLGDRDHASLHLSASETEGSHLAHWPPPQRRREGKPVHHVQHFMHEQGEPEPLAQPHGLGLTRSAFKDDNA